MERPDGTQVPARLAEVITELVDRAADDVVMDVDQTEAVDELVTASRWNPALLMAAADQAGELADERPDDQLEPAVENLRAAEQRVRQRAY